MLGHTFGSSAPVVVVVSAPLDTESGNVIRNIGRLTEREHDVVIVGGGIFGACIAWDAALRGLDVALLEQEDFGHATSANSFKMVHGGIRYIQHGDVARIRESSRERRALLKIAPHLVEPLPIVIPTYGHGMKGKELLSAGMWLYDLLTIDRNRGIGDPDRRIPRGRLLSRDRTLELFPGLPRSQLTGAALFHDAQMYNPTRLVLAFLKGAAGHGAALANYARVEEFIHGRQEVVGVRVHDRLTDSTFTVRGRMIVNAAGPWGPSLIPKQIRRPTATFSRDACFVIPRRITGPHALAVLGATSDPDALLSRPARHLFLVPWRDSTLVGVWHVVHDGPPDSFRVLKEELQAFVDEINSAYPAANLNVDEIAVTNAGLVLFGEDQTSSVNLSYGKRSLVIDHEEADGMRGFLSVIGVRYTTARGVAEKVVDTLEHKLRGRTTKGATEETLLPGGHIGTLSAFTSREISRYADFLDRELVERLVRNYGSELGEILRHDRSGARLASSRYLRAEVLYAVREEMACTLSDVVFRRTDLATAGAPPYNALVDAAAVMAEALDWSQERTEEEISAVLIRFELPARPLSSPVAGARIGEIDQ